MLEVPGVRLRRLSDSQQCPCSDEPLLPPIVGDMAFQKHTQSQPSGYPQKERGGGTALQSRRDNLCIVMQSETPDSLFVFERRG
jgi:hypothetical protein